MKLKTCPNCSRSYSDISLSYCLEDGFVLSAPNNFSPVTQEYEDENDVETVVRSLNQSKKNQSFSITLSGNEIYFGENYSISFQRTLRIPDDGNQYPLPPSLKEFPIYKVSNYPNKVPESWNQHGGIFIPMYQREALWLKFSSVNWKPCAIKVAAGKINAITGKSWNQSISREEQDYVVCPPQPWLDGFKTGHSVVRQFVAMPLGMGYTVEEQLTGKDEFGGIQIIVFNAKSGMFPDAPPEIKPPEKRSYETPVIEFANKAYDSDRREMGLAAGGKINQKIYPDEYGAAIWDEQYYGRVYVHIVNSEMFKKITGLEAPDTPISAETYTRYGLPWFKVYDENKKDVPINEELYTVKSVGLIDKMKGIFSKKDNKPISILDEQIKKVNPNEIDDGDW